MKALRFCAGEASGDHSSGWKLWAQKDDLYLHSSGMGSDLKISFHASGQCHVASSAELVEAEGLPRHERFNTIWQRSPADPDGTTNLVQLIIPRSEMRSDGRMRSRDRIVWLPLPPVDHAIALDIFVVAPQSKAAAQLSVPQQHLGPVPLRNCGWAAVSWRIALMGPHDLATLDTLRTIAISAPQGDTEALAWAHISSPPHFHALLEFVPTLSPGQAV